jgi:hypothetical protein
MDTSVIQASACPLPTIIEGGVFDHGHKYVLYLIGKRTVSNKTIDTSIYKVVAIQSVLLIITPGQGWPNV